MKKGEPHRLFLRIPAMNQARIAVGLLALVVGGSCSGCSYHSGQGWGFHPVEFLTDRALGRKSENEKLWEAGYGFNNPNADKFRREPIVVGAD